MKARRILDAGMTVMLPALMAYELIGEATHEVLGIAMMVLFVAHHLINRSWHTHLARGRYTPVRIVYTALDVILFVLLIAQAVSGIMMAKHTFGFLPHVGRRSMARTVHMAGGYWSFVLMCVHAGLHMGALCRKLAARVRKAPGAVRYAGAAAFGALLIYGAYAFVKRELPLYMLRISEFAFFDFEEPLVFFFADYLLIMLLWMTVGLALGQLLRKRK